MAAQFLRQTVQFLHISVFLKLAPGDKIVRLLAAGETISLRIRSAEGGFWRY